MTPHEVTAQQGAELIGLVLAGGSSERMGEDKGGLAIGGVTLASRARSLLQPHCRDVYISVRDVQADLPHYRSQPLMLDDGRIAGPAAGLLAAWRAHPGCALLALAVDLVLVDASVLAELLRHRNASRSATAFRHPDGVVEPLCTIWEPAAAALVARAADQAAATGRSPSLRRVLEQAPIETLSSPDPRSLESCNTPEAYAAALAALATG